MTFENRPLLAYWQFGAFGGIGISKGDREITDSKRFMEEFPDATEADVRSFLEQMRSAIADPNLPLDEMPWPRWIDEQ